MWMRLLAVLAAAALTACAAEATTASNAAFTPEQRAQIVRIVRDAMKKDPSILRDAIVAVQADNDRIEAQALYDARDPWAGNRHGATTIVEFYDPRCPYCRQLAPQLAAFVAKDGNVRLVYKDLPILGPASELGSRALLAAARQGRYEALPAELMRGSPDDLTAAAIRDDAETLGLDWQRLRHDMDSPAVTRQLAANKQLAADLGVGGTPTLVIGQKIVEGADLPTIEAAVANARYDRSQDQSRAP